MADISKVVLPDGSQYNLRDEVSQNELKYIEDSEPFVFRAAGNGEASQYGGLKETQLVGGSVIWNQQVPDEYSQNTVEGELVTVTDGKADRSEKTLQGDIVSFYNRDIDEFEIKEVESTISPVQDLHGYDTPWPAGGGKNKFNPDSTDIEWVNTNNVIALQNSAKSVRIPATENDIWCLSVKEAVSGNVIEIVYLDGQDNILKRSAMSITTVRSVYSQAPAGTTQLIASISTWSTVSEVQLEKDVQNPTTFAPYSNICPITGWTGANIYDDPVYGGTVVWNQRCKNDSNAFEPFNASSTLSIVNEEIIITSNTNNVEIKAVKPKNLTDTYLYENHIYIASANYKSDGIAEVYGGFFSSDFAGKSFFPLTQSTSYIQDIKMLKSNGTEMFLLRLRSGNSPTGSKGYFKNVMLFDLTQMFGATKADEIYAMEQAEAGSGVAYIKSLFPNDYYAYNTGEETCVSAVNGDTYWKKTVSWQTEAGTVYGGTLDTVSGKLTVDRVIETGGFSRGNIDSSGKLYAISQTVSDMKTWTEYNIPSTIISNCLPTLSLVGARASDKPSISQYLKALYAGGYVGKESALDALLQTLTVVYELATPIEYTLTPQTVTALLGQNYVWSDTGSSKVNLEYNAATVDNLTLSFSPTQDLHGYNSPWVGSDYDQTPYVARAITDTSVADVGNAECDKIIGGTIAWNQQVESDYTVNTISGSIASFGDGLAEQAQSLQTEIMPVQDLHGYDASWPGGGGANIWDEVWEKGSINNDTGTDTAGNVIRGIHYIPVLPNTNYYIVSDGSKLRIYWYESDYTFISSTQALGIETSPANAAYLRIRTTTGYSGGSTYQNDIAVNYPATATTYSPYSNICPITGWTGANVARTGKNMCYQPFPEYVNYNGTTWKNNEDGSVAVTGTPTATAYCLVEFNLPAGTYKVSGAPNYSAQGYNDILVQYPAGTTIARDYNGATESVRTFTLSSNSEGVRVLLRATTNYATGVTFYPMVTLASETSAAYEPYGNTYSVDWTSDAGTVYGGMLDVTTGKLTVNKRYKNARDLTWTWAGSPYVYAVGSSARISDAKLPSSDAEAANVLCSVAVKNSISNMASQHQPGIGISATSGNMAVKLPQIESANDWNDFIENTDVDIVYELATPIEYTLTPQQISILLGQNNIWSDTGNVTVSYKGTDKHLTLKSNHKYFSRINSVESIVNGAGAQVTYKVARDNALNLTQMLGTAIADYVYTLESGTAGAGVTWFKNLFPKTYYTYDVGSLQSVNTSAHKTYKANGTLLGNYALDSTLTLRGIPKLDANNNLYYDGDIYTNDGTVTRKYGIVDLGTLNWNEATTTESGKKRFYAIISDIKQAQSVITPANVICKYPTVSLLSTYEANYGCSVHNSYNNFYIFDPAFEESDANSFKTAMSGVYLVYELATPTTESATAFTAIQSIDPNGTEEYVDAAATASTPTRDVAIPVGHYTNYANICEINGRTSANAYRTGKNFMPTITEPITVNGITAIPQNDGGIALSGTASAITYIDLDTNFDSTRFAGYLVSGFSTTYGVNLYFRISFADDRTGLQNITTNGVAIINNGSGLRFAIRIAGNYQIPEGTILYPMLRAANTSDTFEPYIESTYTSDWTNTAGTVYGGTIDLVSGELRARPYYASYNGETLVGPWMSSMDEYVAGTTPTIGAQVVDLGGAETEYTLTGQDVELLMGINNVRSDTDNIKLTYHGTTYTPTLQTDHKYYLNINGTKSIINGSSSQIVNAVVGRDNIIDITRLVGTAEVANYFYNLEQSESGAGAKYFNSLFPKSRYGYSDESLELTPPMLLKTTGFNQWDEEWETGSINSTSGENEVDATKFRSKNYIHILPDTLYYLKSDDILEFRWYNEEKEYVQSTTPTSNSTFIAPENGKYLRFVCTTSTKYYYNICINLHWNGERDGDYECYQEQTIKLPQQVTRFKGIFQIENNKLFYDGDIADSKHQIIKYGFARLSQYNYTKVSGITSQYDYFESNTAQTSWESIKLCEEYTIVNENELTSSSGNDKVICLTDQGRIRVRNLSFNDASSFKASATNDFLSKLKVPGSVIVNYPQLRSQFAGTVEEMTYVYTSDVMVPFGHNTTYSYNSNAKEKMLFELGVTSASIDFNGRVDFKNATDNILSTIYLPYKRKFASLKSEGWYRIMKLTCSGNGTLRDNGVIINFNILRTAFTATNEVHSIQLYVTKNGCVFTNETSLSDTLGITKIRYITKNYDNYVDIYYNLSTSNTVGVDIIAHQTFDDDSFKFDITNDSIYSITDTTTPVIEHEFIANGHNYTLPIYVNGTIVHNIEE